MLTEAALLWEHPSEGLIHHSCFQPSCDQHAVISLIIMKNVFSEVFKQSSAAMQSAAPPHYSSVIFSFFLAANSDVRHKKFATDLNN